MADLSKIKLNGTEYFIKDATARAAISALEDSIPEVPTGLSGFDNDMGYLMSYTETDPTVPAWAKAESKPTYTATEVGALPNSTTFVSSHFVPVGKPAPPLPRSPLSFMTSITSSGVICVNTL